MDITELMNIFNGSVLVEAGHQEWGYIPETWHLMLPGNLDPTSKREKSADDQKRIQYWQQAHIGESAFIEDHAPENALRGLFPRDHFVRANYNGLILAGATPQHALLITFIRVAVAQFGAIALSTRERSVSVDEYSYFNPPDNDWAKAVVPVVEQSRAIVGWAKKFAGVIISHIVFLFCARGHHYLPEFNEIYQKLYRSSFISDPVGFILPTPEVLYRLSVHCFGVAPLLQMCFGMKRNNQMAAAMLIRFSPHPPIAGVAQFTTMRAAFEDMERHALWQRIRQQYNAPIQRLLAFCDKVDNAPFRYHVASRVLTGESRLMPEQEDYETFRMLAPIALGYIDYLGRRHSLSGQKAITQKYGGIDPSVEMWSRAFDEYGPPSAKDYDVEGFFAALQADRSKQDAARHAQWMKAQVDLDNAMLDRKRKELEIQQLEITVTHKEPSFVLPPDPFSKT